MRAPLTQWWGQQTEHETPSDRSLAASLTDDEVVTAAERLDRRFSAELAASSSLNARGATIAGLAGVMVVLVAEFAGTWLDSRWDFPEFADAVMDPVAVGSVVLLLISALLASWAVRPQRPWRSELRRLIDRIATEPPAREDAELLLEMVEKQRARNERKARWVRWGYHFFALGTIAVALQGAIFIIYADSTGPARSGVVAAQSPDTPDALGLSKLDQDRLAQAYAPTVWVHRQEEYGPSDPEAFITASSLGFRSRRGNRPVRVAARGDVDERRLGARCAAASGGCYSHAGYSAAELTRPHTGGADRAPGLGLPFGLFLDPDNSAHRGQAMRQPDVPVFYELRVRRRQGEARLTYWFFYGYSRPYKPVGQNAASIVHEGDWENIDVALTLDLKPKAVFYYGHGKKPREVKWADVCKVVGDEERCGSDEPGHPLVFSARNSHASYPTAGKTNACAGPLCSSEERNRGYVWEAWTRANLVRSVRDQPWYGFGGAGGAAGRIGDTTGPLGPSPWKLPSDRDPGELTPRPRGP